METIIEVKNLKKSYNGLIAVNRIHFRVYRGEIFGFLGPNGAGKTTTINMLTGLARITEGQIFLKGKDVTRNIKSVQKIIGVVPDENNLYEELSGFDNLCFCGALYGMRKKDREKRARELLNLFGLDNAGRRKFSEYSKGMKRKLTLAAALMHEPEILFLDEPTTGIDVASVRQIRKLIRELNRKGATVFLTTHYIEEAERLCHRVAFIDRGKIITTDTVEKLLDANRDTHLVDIRFKPVSNDVSQLPEKLHRRFPDISCTLKDSGTIRLTSRQVPDIAPVVNYLASEGFFVLEARLIKPTLEEAFVKATGIEVDLMNK
ncbi:MAG TPA: ABC transporter ATP-binding protein [Bacteroidetes bacterium]|nr:ABC transporter ATP-binding protein [Bacteroidota bacterium]